MLADMLDRFYRIDTLIRTRNTGKPAQLAEILGVSEQTVYRYIRIMKSWGAPILYSNLLGGYYYTEDVVFFCGFVKEGKDGPPKSNGFSVTSMKSYLEHLAQHYLNHN
jgi:biotin operon repressor